MNKKIIIKMIKESQVLTEQEKKELIRKAKIESFVNSYKIIINYLCPYFAILANKL